MQRPAEWQLLLPPTSAAGVPRCVDERVVEIEHEDEAPARTQAQRAVGIKARGVRRRHAQTIAERTAVELHAGTPRVTCRSVLACLVRTRDDRHRCSCRCVISLKQIAHCAG